MNHTPAQLKKIATQVIDTEIDALQGIKTAIDDNFYQAAQSMLNCSGKVIVIGMGKSGHIARKIAATLASTGTPAFFVHPAEASHGDIGMISTNDVALAISNSGETQELVNILPVIKRLGCCLIGMSGNIQSTLAKEANHHISTYVTAEACPLGLAPTSSTTATLAMGDALAIALLEARGFTQNDFALSHPAGSLGKKLLLRVQDLMHTEDDLPVCPEEMPVIDALFEISAKGMGFTAVVNKNKHLIGVYTDGDLRRTLDKKMDIQHTLLKDVVKIGCVTTSPTMLAAEALKLMEDKSINALVVTNEYNQPIGAINMHDLLKAKVI